MRRDCCEIFELHKTEYGFCYSFNSQMAEATARRKYRRHSEKRPRSATSYGAWSGVRVTARLSNVTKPPYSGEWSAIWSVTLIRGDCGVRLLSKLLKGVYL